MIREHPDLKGLNCTIPHKKAILPLLDSLSEEARSIGAANVIRIQRDGKGKITLTGFNTDVVGFTESIKPLLSPNHHKALVLGTGGASNAICFGLSKLGLSHTCVSRSHHPGMLCYDDLTPAVVQAHEVIVNCSPVGMFPHTGEAPDLPYEALDKRHLLYDLIYNTEVTEFMRRGALQGATVKNGLEMLRLQALASWKIWNQKS